MGPVKTTLYISIVIQIVSLLYGLYIYTTTKDTPQNDTLYEILFLENVVQFVEFSFYFLVSFIFTRISTKNLAKYRYYDWFITTPVMLLTTLFFFYNEKQRFGKANNETKENSQKQLSIGEIASKEWMNIVKLVLSNAGMLAMGYLYELGKIGLFTSNTIGFGFLAYSFYILYQYVATPISRGLFWIMGGIWSLYGVAAWYNPVVKNTAFNLLDVVSKNFYGIFIAYMIQYYGV